MIESGRSSLTEATNVFNRDGFYVAQGLFSQEEVAHILETYMEASADGPVPGISEVRPSHGTYAEDDPLARYPRMMHPHLHPETAIGRVALKTMLDPRLHPYLQAFMQDEPVAVQSMFYFKPPKARGQELHQDNYYLAVKPGTCMAAWIAVDDADFENGGMRVVPGSQDMEVVCPQHADASTSFTTDYVAPPEGLEVLDVSLKKGDVLFFNGSLIHGSTPNTSENRYRRSLICHYIPETSKEVSGGYRKFMQTFDHRDVQVDEATGGGPCGTAQPTQIH